MKHQIRSLSHHRRIGGAAAGPWYDPLNSGLAVVCAYQPKGAASYAASLSNLANPGTNDATEGTAPAWDSTNGWKFTAGSSHYLIGPTATQAYTTLVQFTNAASISEGRLFGFINAGSQEYNIRPRYASAFHSYRNNTTRSVSGQKTAGNLAIVGLSGGAFNGVIDSDTFTGVSSGLPVYIGAMNWKNSSATNHLTCYIQALAMYSETLGAADLLAVAEAAAAL